MKIDGINQASLLKAPGQTKPAAHEGPNAGQFASMLSQYIQNQNTEHHLASHAAAKMTDGSNSNVSETLLAVQKADISFQMLLAVRNKLVDAYREVMRMQV